MLKKKPRDDRHSCRRLQLFTQTLNVLPYEKN